MRHSLFCHWPRGTSLSAGCAALSFLIFTHVTLTGGDAARLFDGGRGYAGLIINAQWSTHLSAKGNVYPQSGKNVFKAVCYSTGLPSLQRINLVSFLLRQEKIFGGHKPPGLGMFRYGFTIVANLYGTVFFRGVVRIKNQK